MTTRCVCPMGGDRDCPDDCPISVWANLSPTDRKTQRKSVATKLYQQKFTMEQIATQLGVTNQTISNDLREFPNHLETQPRASTRGRKGEGRPKGSTKPRAARLPKAIEREETVGALRDAGLTTKEIAEKVGLGERAVAQALEHVDIKREAIPDIDPSTLSMTAQEKLAIAIRQEKARLAASFEKYVASEVKRRVDEIILPKWKKQIDDAKRIYERRRKFMSKEQFNAIRRGLHPDSRQSISDKKLAEAFDAFMALEKHLLDEVDSPTDFGDLPSSLAEWDKMRARRSSKRVSNPVGRRH